jgi:hypothetical protein
VKSDESEKEDASRSRRSSASASASASSSHRHSINENINNFFDLTQENDQEESGGRNAINVPQQQRKRPSSLPSGSTSNTNSDQEESGGRNAINVPQQKSMRPSSLPSGSVSDSESDQFESTKRNTINVPEKKRTRSSSLPSGSVSDDESDQEEKGERNAINVPEKRRTRPSSLPSGSGSNNKKTVSIIPKAGRKATVFSLKKVVTDLQAPNLTEKAASSKLKEISERATVERSRVNLGNHGACGAIVDLMRQHLNSLKVATQFCFALWNLAAFCLKNTIMLGEHGACQLVPSLMRTHHRDSFQSEISYINWAEHWAGAMLNLSHENDKNIEDLSRNGACKEVIIVLSKCQNRVNIQGMCLSLIQLLAPCEINRVELFGACPWIVAAIQHRNNRKEMIFRGMHAMSSLLRLDNKNSSARKFARNFLESHACTAVIAAMQKNAKNVDVASLGCETLIDLAKSDAIHSTEVDVAIEVVAEIQKTDLDSDYAKKASILVRALEKITR